MLITLYLCIHTIFPLCHMDRSRCEGVGLKWHISVYLSVWPSVRLPASCHILLLVVLPSPPHHVGLQMWQWICSEGFWRRGFVRRTFRLRVAFSFLKFATREDKINHHAQNDRTLFTAISAMRSYIPNRRVITNNSCITTVSDTKALLVCNKNWRNYCALAVTLGVSEISWSYQNYTKFKKYIYIYYYYYYYYYYSSNLIGWWNRRGRTEMHAEDWWGTSKKETTLKI